MSKLNDHNPTHAVLEGLTQALSRATGLPQETVASQLGHPPKPGMGDYAFPCFAFAKDHKMAPPAAAAQLAEKMNADPALAPLVSRIEAAGPFLNIRANPGALSDSIINWVRESDSRFGGSAVGAGKTIVIDYSSPNFAKPFHVGHLMSTVIGASLVRIFRALSYNVVGVNHLGDWGVQCGFQFLAWQRADPVEREKQLAERGLNYLRELYVEINSAAKEVARLEELLVSKDISSNPEERARIKAALDAIKPDADARDLEARVLFKRLEDGDPELKALWERIRRVSLDFMQAKYYDRLGIKFESDAGEAFYEPMLKPLLDNLEKSGVAVESEGALVIPMDDEPAKSPEKDGEKKNKKPPLILRKSDAASIYATRDLAALLYRKQTYNFEKNIYVVNVQQSGHFEMLFKALVKMGHAWAKDCVHVSFGIMKIKEGDAVMAMTTRGGQMVPLDELLDRMAEKVSEIVRDKNPDLDPAKVAIVSEAVGVGAVSFWIQSRRRNSNILFDWQTATNPSGDTGPYLQYTHARACSILRKSGQKREQWISADLKLLTESEETAVVKQIERFPQVLRQAAADYEPSLISTWLLDLASSFGNFLNKHRVLDSAPGQREARLALVDTLRSVLARGLAILGISAPDEM